MSDQGIPRRAQTDPQRRTGWPRSGWFTATRDGKVVLQSRRGDQWGLSFVTIKQGWWGSADNAEGMSKLPRVRRYDASGNIAEPGDIVVITPDGGDPRRVIVEAGFRGGNVQDADLVYNHASPGASENRLFGRLQPKRADGSVVGVIEWELAADDTGVELRVQEAASTPPPESGWTVVRVEHQSVSVTVPSGGTFVVDNDKIRWGGEAAVHPFILSKDLFSELFGWFTAMDAFMAALVSASGTPGGYTAAASAFVSLQPPAQLASKFTSGAFESTKINGE